MNSFDVLPLGEKMRMMKTGKLISEFTDHHQIVSLYKVNNLLVEKRLDPSSSKITRISSVSEMDLLTYFPHLTFRSICDMVLN